MIFFLTGIFISLTNYILDCDLWKSDVSIVNSFYSETEYQNKTQLSEIVGKWNILVNLVVSFK